MNKAKLVTEKNAKIERILFLIKNPKTTEQRLKEELAGLYELGIEHTQQVVKEWYKNS